MNSIAADSQHAQRFGQVCTLLLQSEQYTCVQDAETFSRLLCVSRQGRRLLLHAAVGCLLAEVPRYHNSAHAERSMVQWLVRQVRAGNIKALHIEADDFFPDLYITLAGQLQETAAAAGIARQQQHQTALSRTYPAVNAWPACTNAAAGWMQKPAGLLETPATSSKTQPGAEPDVAAGSQASTLSHTQHTRHPHVTISWHVCGLPPSSLPYIPGASLTHLTLRDSTLSPKTLQELTCLKTLQHLLLPNLNPDPASSPRTLSTLTALRQLFIRHPSPAEQHSLPISLQQLTIAQRTPPWVEAAPSLQPLTLTLLTSLTSLTVQEWFPNGISHACRLPGSLQHLSVACVTTAAPLLALKHLRCVQLSSLRHSTPEELLPLSSISGLELQVGIDEPEAPVRLFYEDLVAYRHVFAAIPVVLHTLKVLPQQPQLEQQQQQPIGLCKAAVAGISSLRGLRSLTLEGAALGRYVHVCGAATAAAAGGQYPGRHMTGLDASGTHSVTPLELAAALGCVTGLTRLSLCNLQLAAGIAVTSQEAGEPCQHKVQQALSSLAASNSSSSSSVRYQVSASESSHPTSPAAAAGTAVAGPADWRPAVQLIAKHPSLQRLALTRLPLGSAVAELSAALQLQSLELHSCHLPAVLVAELIAALGFSSLQDHPAGHDTVTLRNSHSDRLMSHVGMAVPDGRFSGGASPVPLSGTARAAKGRVMHSGCLTSLIFTQQ